MHAQCKKGDDIAAFLAKCREQFPELRGISVENLMYIKVGLDGSARGLRLVLNLPCAGGSHHTPCKS